MEGDLLLEGFEGVFKEAFGAKKGIRELQNLENAVMEFEAGHYKDALTTFSRQLKSVPTIPELQELCGLAHYRLGNYEKAIKHLEIFKAIVQSTEQNPVLADCYRALDNHERTEQLWEELKSSDPPEDLLAECRIVFVGSLADQGDFAAAKKVLIEATGGEQRFPKKPSEAELYQVYALADIYEQVGDIPKATAIFKWVAQKDLQKNTDAEERILAI